MCCGGTRQLTSRKQSWMLTTSSRAFPPLLRREPEPRSRPLRSHRLAPRPSPRPQNRPNLRSSNDTCRVQKDPSGRVKTRPFFCASASSAAVCVVSITANRFHPGGHYVCRQHFGDFMGPSRPPELDNAHLVRARGSANRVVAFVAIVEDRGLADRSRCLNAYQRRPLCARTSAAAADRERFSPTVQRSSRQDHAALACAKLHRKRKRRTGLSCPDRRHWHRARRG